MSDPGALVPPKRLTVRVGLAFVQTLRPLLYVLLATSAVLTFLAGEPGRLPEWLKGLAPAAFGLFLIAFAVYRLRMMAAKRYPALLGFFQLGLGVLVWVLLLPGQRQKLAAGDDVTALLGSSDARVRAVAAEAAGGRENGQRYAPALVELLGDSQPHVRESARQALRRIAGTDPAAGQSEADAAQTWRLFARSHGWIP